MRHGISAVRDAVTMYLTINHVCHYNICRHQSVGFWYWRNRYTKHIPAVNSIIWCETKNNYVRQSHTRVVTIHIFFSFPAGFANSNTNDTPNKQDASKAHPNDRRAFSNTTNNIHNASNNFLFSRPTMQQWPETNKEEPKNPAPSNNNKTETYTSVKIFKTCRNIALN